MFTAFEDTQLLTFGSDRRRLDYQAEWRRWVDGQPRGLETMRRALLASSRRVQEQSHKRVAPPAPAALSLKALLVCNPILHRRVREMCGKRKCEGGWSNQVAVEAFVVSIRDAAAPDKRGLLQVT